METSNGKTNPDDVISIFMILDLFWKEKPAFWTKSAGLLLHFNWDVASTVTKLEMPFLSDHALFVILIVTTRHGCRSILLPPMGQIGPKMAAFFGWTCETLCNWVSFDDPLWRTCPRKNAQLRRQCLEKVPQPTRIIHHSLFFPSTSECRHLALYLNTLIMKLIRFSLCTPWCV